MWLKCPFDFGSKHDLIKTLVKVLWVNWLVIPRTESGIRGSRASRIKRWKNGAWSSWLTRCSTEMKNYERLKTELTIHSHNIDMGWSVFVFCVFHRIGVWILLNNDLWSADRPTCSFGTVKEGKALWAQYSWQRVANKILSAWASRYRRTQRPVGRIVTRGNQPWTNWEQSHLLSTSFRLLIICHLIGTARCQPSANPS